MLQHLLQQLQCFFAASVAVASAAVSVQRGQLLQNVLVNSMKAKIFLNGIAAVLGLVSFR